MKTRSQWVTFGVGVLLLLGLLNHVGLDEILPLVRHTGWRFGWIAPYFLLPILFAALSWKVFLFSAYLSIARGGEGNMGRPCLQLASPGSPGGWRDRQGPDVEFSLSGPDSLGSHDSG